MDIDDHDGQSEAIAKDWGVSAETLNDTSWTLQEISGNDGEIYGYVVRFAEGTPPELLAEFGLDADELTREVSLWAFDSPEPDDGIFPIDAPFPDISDFYDEEYDDSELPEIPTARVPEIAALTDELLRRLDDLEREIGDYKKALPPRNHNNPPGLVEDDPISSDHIITIIKAVKSLRLEVSRGDPNTEAINVQISALQMVATSIVSWTARKFDLGVDSTIKWAVPVGMAWAFTHTEKIVDALHAAAHTASKLAVLLGGG